MDIHTGSFFLFIFCTLAWPAKLLFEERSGLFLFLGNLFRLHPHSFEHIGFLSIIEGIVHLLPLRNFVERRLCDVEVSRLNKLAVVAVEERKEERADVCSVHVGVGHDHDTVVAEFRNILLLADAHAHRDDECLDFIIREHLVEPRLLHVENFSPEWEDRLELTVAPLLRGASGGISLD